MLEGPALRLAEQWMALARQDLSAAEVLLAHSSEAAGVAGIAAYHCQQAAEKALKALLVRHDARVVKTHDLNLLVELIADHSSVSESLVEAALRLSPFSTAYRYPNSLPALLVDDARAAIADAHQLFRFARSEIDGNTL